MSDVIRLTNICNRFGDWAVHDGLSLAVQEEEILGIVGGSGTGKSVLLRTMIGLHRPDGGVVDILGVPVLTAEEEALQQLRRRWGVLFQNGALISSLTVEENVRLPLDEHTRLDKDTRVALSRLKLEMVGLPPKVAAQYPSELSGGMRKRVALARALALDPCLLFLDEPTAGLDPIAANEFDLLIRQLRDALGLSVVMITHDLDSLFTLCDRIAVLVDKQVVVDRLQPLLTHPHPWIQSYFHGPRARAALTSSEVNRG